MSVTTTDEELTPLHWLHDKNLLKGKLIISRSIIRYSGKSSIRSTKKGNVSLTVPLYLPLSRYQFVM